VIGTPAVSTKVGDWESSNQKVLEITSHPNTNSFSGAFKGVAYQYLVGLTRNISVGAQSITPRKFQYTGMTMTAEVTRAAAELAQQMPIGTLSRLQMRLVGSSEHGGVTDFENIHLGVFKGLKWNGEKYILNFSDALEAAQQRVTEDGTYRAASASNYSWFAGIGVGQDLTTMTAVGTFGGSIGVTLTAPYDAESSTRTGHAYKKVDSFGGQDFHYGLPLSPLSSRFHNLFFQVTNTENESTFLVASGLFTSADPTPRMRLGSVYSNAVFPYLGRQQAGDTDHGMEAGSKVKQVCIIHGTPVTEIVNTIYTMGYHHQMVCGLFGETVDEAKNALNIMDINAAHGRFNEAWAASTGVSARRTGVIPMFAAFTKESQSGYSDIKKICSKYGVFPRFKEGGYGVGACTHPQYDKYPRSADTLILAQDIESAEYNLPDPQSKGIYSVLTQSDSDHSSDSPSVFDGNYTINGTSPIIPQFTLNTSDVAPGQVLGEKYFDYFNNQIFSRWFAAQRRQVVLRLCGFKFAHLAPGDTVDIFMGVTDSNRAHGWGLRGTPSAGRHHVLTSVDSVEARQQGAYTVMSVKVDWIGAKVHLTLSRFATGKANATFSLVPAGDGRLANELGVPQDDIDPDY
jgi:hypothetical protein|tara:strand:- start:332 stop:2215 length:1884 start_codon:yes stop_codon:yes gene_type:complete